MATDARSVLLSDANREVQAADHILSAVYPLTRDPKALVGALEHELRALENASRALHEQGAAASLHIKKEADAARERISSLLERHSRAPTVFTRGPTRIIADEGFSGIATIDERSVTADLAIVKRFVHEANTHILLQR